MCASTSKFSRKIFYLYEFNSYKLTYQLLQKMQFLYHFKFIAFIISQKNYKHRYRLMSVLQYLWRSCKVTHSTQNVLLLSVPSPSSSPLIALISTFIAKHYSWFLATVEQNCFEYSMQHDVVLQQLEILGTNVKHSPSPYWQFSGRHFYSFVRGQ